jgi:hypothetical protein
MGTYRHERAGPSRTRWIVVGAILIAIAVAVVLIVLYATGGGSSGGSGGPY